VSVGSFQFGEFRLDCDGFELTRASRSLKVERMPMELLILLVARNGQLVTRHEIAERLWQREVFVDTEHGINTAVRKIRAVLRDDPDEPRFVQTVTGKGYRFIAPITKLAGVREENAPSDRALEGAGALDNGAPAPAIMPAITMQQPRRSRRNTWIAVLAATGVLAIALVIASRVHAHGRAEQAIQPRISSLAVIPLDNLSGDPGQDYFADGMTDELTTMLAKNSTLRIVSRTSAMQYKGAHRPLREIAQALGVDGILEGSVERADGKVHMTVQLIDGPSDTHLWADSYDRDANDVVTLPTEAAEAIAKRLHSTAPVLKPARYVNPEAHDAYLHGRYLWFANQNDAAGKYFRKATELQPDYAPGWSGLSMYYGAGAVDGLLNPQESLAPMEAAAMKAVELDDSLPEAHLVLGASLFVHKWDWAAADQELLRAIELDPKFAEAHHLRAKVLATLNRHQEAIEEQKKAMELDPFGRPFALAYSYQLARQYDAAITDARERLESMPNDWSLHWILAVTYRCKGMDKDSVKMLEQQFLLSGDKSSAASIRRAFEQGGYNAVLHWQIIDAERKAAKQYVSPVDVAILYAQLGQREKTLALLEEGYRQHSPSMLWIQCDPAYDFLHSDPRYRSLIQRIGLPPAY
jgi:TolB-like protein/DNA-binding winged helix-turn-helix (wHTH) protein